MAVNGDRCRRGHVYTPETTRVELQRGLTRRVCRTCDVLRHRGYTRQARSFPRSMPTREVPTGPEAVAALADALARLDRGEGCWLWPGETTEAGYGRVRIGRRFIKAHRLSYRLLVGPLPDGLVICHRCDVRACINPAHLFVGTQADNVRDALEKGRFRRA